MRYASAAAFRRALDDRLLAQSQQTGRSLARLRKEVVFDRLLARLLDVAPGRWVLKGGLALDYRFGDRARTTRDIDLAMADGEEGATTALLAAQAADLGDFFGFSVERTAELDELQEGAAVRYRVRAELAGRLFEEFVLDVGFDVPPDTGIEVLRGPDLLAFADIPPVEAPALASLSARELMVAERVARGASNREIADALGISERTVKAHLSVIFTKLNVRDRVQLALAMNNLPTHGTPG